MCICVRGAARALSISDDTDDRGEPLYIKEVDIYATTPYRSTVSTRTGAARGAGMPTEISLLIPAPFLL